MNKLSLIGALLLLISCNKETPIAKLFEKIDSENSSISFINEIYNTEEFNIFTYRNFYNGGGVAVGDVNNDGLADIYFSSNLGSNKLYINKGNFNFEDISESSGTEVKNKWSTGVTMVDINNDGLLDIYVCNAGQRENADSKNTLLINQGDNTFIDEAAIYGLDDGGYTTHCSFFDYDNDGDLDAYILNNSFIPVNTLNYNNKRALRSEDWPVKDFLKGGGDKLLRNEGGTFTDVSKEAGIYGSLIGFGLGVMVMDVNDDKFLDIYVCNDFFERDYLYINNKNGTYTESLEEKIDHISHSSMGADFGDINNDGSVELFVTDMLPKQDSRLKQTTTFDNIDLRTLKSNQGFYNQFMQNTLQLNKGNGEFVEISNFAGVEATDWSWGSLFMDADNDGNTDILVCNGIYKDVIDQDFIDFFANDIIQKQALTGEKEEIETIINKMPSVPLENKIFRNFGNNQFSDYSDQWGLSEKTFSNGAAYGDFDNDGDLDLVINNVNQKALLYRNNSKQDFIAFQLIGEDTNVDAIGSKVNLYSGDNIYTKMVMPARGFQSSVDKRLNFGLGNGNDIDSIHVFWPDGSSQSVIDWKVNEYNKIEIQKEKRSEISSKKNSEPFLAEIDNNFEAHKEDDFVDFYFERNIPMQLSKEGPCSATGDINGDGKLDIFLGSAHNSTAQLYFSNSNGFESVQTDFWNRFQAYEDTAAEFVDIDNDGDLDLIVGSGGNNVQFQNKAFIDRLYINNNGVFDYSYNAIPPNAFNTACIKSHDFNGDGYLDLFVGSRSTPGAYGLSPGSFIYMNNQRGGFIDVTNKLAPELALAGMITDAVWVDIMGDENKELVLVGEWMSPKILSYNGRTFDIKDSNLSGFSGLWQDVEAEDVDNDGDLDLAFGNMGLNFALKADSLHPLLIWINDFDNNGSIEKIITRSVDGKDKPIYMKNDLLEQIPMLKKQNLHHVDYAEKSIHELFPPEILKTSSIKQINFLESIIAINNGNGDFTIVSLPSPAQISNINVIKFKDFDHDGSKELITGGNNHFLLPQFSMLDASRGDIYKNNGNGHFQYVGNLGIRGVIRSMDVIDDKLVIGINNQKPRSYKIPEN
ncbi:VCBS repeat-containing protein [Portibacter lacus]|uniref:ASPIC/UnbV domain-containing protein n=1 Tax=Portibacter lacus TaxID=1099794 RepID=A0AA37WEJ7_9BACT|nr:VCBS repeat-containing protein [Portibacter lacus]GLR16799.1 hypothetical protein GCM10007940_14140 [Portibacter lacus]